ncbi:DUF1634 domain-containing protein [Providencia rettgeri]|uniref:DUF1634 domain-containing protein n=1 Tax=Providencia TaxID=586 RepID=UPI00065E3193|nr:DUF1634 domain-containing protein [Providencia rettgeri]ELR5175762.1 DUF1634 domain-containing protein [Providencia rettgeri]ELR5261425.1 DUF1634 domain-containing protein [Providencia rettgeri]MDK3006430.1 DUF1634 domain-containing protein [Providencia rettgeri]
MKSEKGYLELRDQVIALLLRYGTWLATTLIAIGVALTALKPFWGTSLLPLHGSDIVNAGIALFILLPVLRVILMLAFFIRDRDYIYVAITTLVLVFIAAGVIIEL